GSTHPTAPEYDSNHGNAARAVMLVVSVPKKLSCAGNQDLTDPGEAHEIFPDALAGGAHARARVVDRAFHVRVAGIAGMAERLREIHQAEREVVDAVERSELVDSVKTGPALDHQTER